METEGDTFGEIEWGQTLEKEEDQSQNLQAESLTIY